MCGQNFFDCVGRSNTDTVTRLADLLHFGQLFKIILHKWPSSLGNFCNGGKIFHFNIEIIFGQLL